MRATLTAITVLLPAFMACGDDEAVTDGGGDDATELEERADQLGARSAAEAVRADLHARDLGSDESLRSVEILEESTGTIPGDPAVLGLEDTTGDGLDDDGLVQIEVGEETACLSVGEDDDTIDVSGGTC